MTGLIPDLATEMGPRRIVFALAYEIAGKHRIDVRSLFSAHRAKKYAWPRQELYARAKKETGLGRVLLGKILGRDPQTIWHGIRAHEARMGAQSGADTHDKA